MSTTQDQEHDFITDPIPKLILALAIPISTGFFFNTMYNVVDTFIAGFLSMQALAALSISSPIFFALIAFGSGIGSGVTALIANALGEEKNTLAKHYAKQAISFGVLLSIAVTLLGVSITPALLVMLGAKGTYLATASSYLIPIFWGSLFIIMTFVLNAILNAIGDTKSYRNVLVLGFFINGILSPTLALGWLGFPALGVFGIALATILTNILGVGYLGVKVFKTDLIISNESWHRYFPEKQAFLNIAGQGFPASLSMMTIAVGAFVIVYFVSQFGESAVAGYGAALRIEQIFLIPGVGINIAVLTLIGQNNGAKKFQRVHEIIRVAIRYSMYLGTLSAIFLLFFSKYLVGIFTDDPIVIAAGVQYLSIAALITWAYGFLFVTDSVFRGLKQPMFPLIMGITRHILLPYPVILFVTSILALGILGIWWSIFCIVWSAAIITIFYMRYIARTKCPLNKISECQELG